ncbi:MAG: acetylserotonin O-methyltransferase [Deltaproteobacteria bacterium]|nr:acetylserotonin O-methyltransferase [Deltaproteobacteria bacterium]
MPGEITPGSIFRVARNFMESRLLLTGVDLNLFSLLAPKPLPAEEVSSSLKADLRAVTMLLNALSALGYLVKKDNRYQTEPSIAPLLSEGEPESILPGLQHSAHLWRTWSQLTEVVRHGEPAKRLESWDDKDRMKAFIGAMHVGASAAAPEIIQAISPGQAKALIDVGGGSGTYTIAFLQAAPDMKATIFDLPPVIEMARERITDAGLLDRVNLIPGDFYKDELPAGHDLALLSAIIHQNSHEQNLMLYKRVFKALDSGGRIVIRDHVMEPDRTRPLSGAIFAINMLVNTPGGGTYTFEEIEQGLTEAGFTRVKALQARGMFSLVEAFKP